MTTISEFQHTGYIAAPYRRAAIAAIIALTAMGLAAIETLPNGSHGGSRTARADLAHPRLQRPLLQAANDQLASNIETRRARGSRDEHPLLSREADAPQARNTHRRRSVIR